MSYGILEEKLICCLEQYPPDFEGASQAIAEGADINVQDDLGETLLSTIFLDQPDYREKSGFGKDGRYLPQIVAFFSGKRL